MNKPFGLALLPARRLDPQYLYAANTDGVVRFPYKLGDLKASAAPVKNCRPASSAAAATAHAALVFSPDGKKLYVTVGSGSNDDEHNNPAERESARSSGK